MSKPSLRKGRQDEFLSGDMGAYAPKKRLAGLDTLAASAFCRQVCEDGSVGGLAKAKLCRGGDVMIEEENRDEAGLVC